MELAKEITYYRDRQHILTFLFDPSKTEESEKLVEAKKFKSLLSYGRYEDKLIETYGEKLTILPTVVNPECQ